MSSLIQIFAKAPVAGQVKTRLAKDKGDAFALAVHQRLCETVIATALNSGADAVEVWTTDAAAFPYFEALGVACWLQQGLHLGTRMDFALRHGLARHDNVVLIGADAPSIDAAYLAEAFRGLEQSSVVIGPAADGGYVLVGVTTPAGFLFRDMPWGTPAVMGITLERLFSSGVGFHVLADRWDIDTLEDLQQHLPDWLS
ncbi:TIGR04282 family arsenosugar biosynthesis glycosyltransferase [Ketobacter sp.]|uniref:TIGR04282 family arsenosugar biosynthesis glycosyltransferase n=1 Tax=Ketobacter sp. TaxID=2083498 RepID=UPI000F27C5DA|nr:TIGR04282 family arsenosugar biosynthesis glycosyltransferase [Ketobacter sp.]RLT92595.1 MAG: glycosyltransferase [Ketobacter sp.]